MQPRANSQDLSIPRHGAETLATAGGFLAAGAVLSLLFVAAQSPLAFLSIPLSLAAIGVGVASIIVARRNRTPAPAEARIVSWVGAAALVLSFCVFAFALRMSGATREAANRVKCNVNLPHIGRALRGYASLHEGLLPSDLGALIAEPGDSALFICPSSDHEKAAGPTTQQTIHAFRANSQLHCSYVLATPSVPLSSLPENAVLVYEHITNHDQERIAILFVNGNVDWVHKLLAPKVISELQAGKNPPPSLK